MIGIVIQQYYVDAVQALDILNDAKTQATAGTVLPTGWLRLIVPVWFATPYFVGILARFNEQYPDIQFSIDLENRFTDLVAEGYDLALRVVGSPQENLIVKLLGEIKFFHVASPSFLAKHGYPKNQNDLQHWQGVLPNYTQLITPLTAFHDSNNTQMLAQMAMAGMGIAILPEWLIADAVADGRLIKIFAEEFNAVPLYAVYMSRAFLSSKIRLLIDFLHKYLNGDEA